jgi:hypothetical protein
MGRLEITHLNLMLIIADVYTTGIPFGPARMNERSRKISPVDSTHKNGKAAGPTIQPGFGEIDDDHWSAKALGRLQVVR